MSIPLYLQSQATLYLDEVAHWKQPCWANLWDGNHATLNATTQNDPILT